MRGNTFEQVSTLTPDELVPKDHPIRRIKVIVEAEPPRVPWRLFSLSCVRAV